MAHVAPYKKELVDDLAKRFRESQVVGIASIQGIPAPQFQAIRQRLRGRATITVSKNNLLRLALKAAADKKPHLEALASSVEGQTAVVTADLNPFKLFKELEATKTKAPARGGEVAPEDLWVREGETPFKPGPVVGDLQKAGIPAAIDRGKVVIKKDKLLVKAGDRIPRDVAHVLARLEIFPLIVGLDLRGAYEDGTVFRRDALAVDDTVVRAQILDASRRAFNLAMFVAYPSKATIRSLLGLAQRDGLSLAVESGFPTKDSVRFLFAKAQAQMLALASRAPGALDDDLRSKVSGASGPAPPPAGSKTEEKKEEKKEASEEDAAAGLGALFGR
ncbi:MAG: 50S ribosomal protein L10 [Euryarchaeota archaeon RBG_16_68_13]|nr:MAG: 50S ribosomal protein L10 [Euryarchaeota archaeon RBG_16_68_13]